MVRHAEHLCSANDAIAAHRAIWHERKLTLDACEADLHKRRAAAAESAENLTAPARRCGRKLNSGFAQRRSFLQMFRC